MVDRFCFFISMSATVNRITNKIELMIDTDIYNGGHMQDQIEEFGKQAVSLLKKAKTNWIYFHANIVTQDHKLENFTSAERFGLEKVGSTFQFSEYKGQEQWTKYGNITEGLKVAIEQIINA